MILMVCVAMVYVYCFDSCLLQSACVNFLVFGCLICTVMVVCLPLCWSSAAWMVCWCLVCLGVYVWWFLLLVRYYVDLLVLLLRLGCLMISAGMLRFVV